MKNYLITTNYYLTTKLNTNRTSTIALKHYSTKNNRKKSICEHYVISASPIFEL